MRESFCKGFSALVVKRIGLVKKDISPILQLDEGLVTKPTYNGLSRKSSNSFEGLEDQALWSCLALLSFSCFYYNPYICKILGNNITNFS
jgi:hypothetical protein